MNYVITVDKTGITAPNVPGKCGSQIIFDIVNKTGDIQKVRIPPAEIVPKYGDATPGPMASGQYAVEVPAGATKQIILDVKAAKHFHWGGVPSSTMTYKYTVYSNEFFSDPDIEINP